MCAVTTTIAADEEKATLEFQEISHQESLHLGLHHGKLKLLLFVGEIPLAKKPFFLPIGGISAFGGLEFELDTQGVIVVSVDYEIRLDPERPFEFTRRHHIVGVCKELVERWKTPVCWRLNVSAQINVPLIAVCGPILANKAFVQCCVSN